MSPLEVGVAGKPGDKVTARLVGGPHDGRTCTVTAAYWLEGRPALPVWVVFPGPPQLDYQIGYRPPGEMPVYAYKGDGALEIAIDPELGQPVPETPPLDPALLPYLDWPVWMRENGLRCEKPDCPCDEGEILEHGPDKWILSGHITLRTVLESLKQHAEGKP